MSLFSAAFSLFEPVPKNGWPNYCVFFLGWVIFCTSVLLLSYQASDVVDCGGECRLEAKVFNMKGF